ncbi:UNVERIFIED_CONTAM: Cyclin-dependent protein kinase inhibitor SMR9 [Sesamum radiatum]|uniref:Cyclin-dependent protein kinase inhibitor SMR9 n=1 Tax=Sesamum radiatum TaxID=300843 RepID=A0AAW2UT21_SESRA
MNPPTMSPSCSRRRRRITRTTTRKPSSRRTLFKKKQQQHNSNLQTSSKNQEPSVVSPATSPTKLPSTDVENVDSISACSTPKGRRYRIPEIKTCPPAPKKRRVFTAAGCNSLRRTPVAFFAHPDIELFFYLALRGIPV